MARKMRDFKELGVLPSSYQSQAERVSRPCSSQPVKSVEDSADLAKVSSVRITFTVL